MTSGGDDARESDGGGVLGNLPRSRPGHRSDKRGEAAEPAPPARRPGTAAGGARGGAARGPMSARAASPAPQRSAGGPLGEAVRVAGRAARLGRDVAGGVLKRLPRP